jgi:hypothetical protein
MQNAECGRIFRRSDFCILNSEFSTPREHSLNGPLG